jgi:hypothetical protein
VDEKTVAELKAEIDNMTHVEMCRHWRFDSSDSPYVQGNVGDYLRHRLFDEFGGFTPEISKALGW